MFLFLIFTIINGNILFLNLSLSSNRAFWTPCLPAMSTPATTRTMRPPAMTSATNKSPAPAPTRSARNSPNTSTKHQIPRLRSNWLRKALPATHNASNSPSNSATPNVSFKRRSTGWARVLPKTNCSPNLSNWAPSPPTRRTHSRTQRQPMHQAIR